MNDVCEMWSLPWHALLKDLALELDGDASARSMPCVKPGPRQGVVLTTGSWLHRARVTAAIHARS